MASDLENAVKDIGKPWNESSFDPNVFEEIFQRTLSPAVCKSFFRANPELPVQERDYYLSKLCQFLWLFINGWITNLTNPGRAFEPALRKHLDSSLNALGDESLSRVQDFDWWSFVVALRDSNPALSSVERAKDISKDLRMYMTSLREDASQASDIESISNRRKRLFQRFKESGGTAATVCREANVHKSDFYNWRSGKLSEKSVMTRRIEAFLKRQAGSRHEDS